MKEGDSIVIYEKKYEKKTKYKGFITSFGMIKDYKLVNVKNEILKNEYYCSSLNTFTEMYSINIPFLFSKNNEFNYCKNILIEKKLKFNT